MQRANVIGRDRNNADNLLQIFILGGDSGGSAAVLSGTAGVLTLALPISSHVHKLILPSTVQICQMHLEIWDNSTG